MLTQDNDVPGMKLLLQSVKTSTGFRVGLLVALRWENL